MQFRALRRYVQISTLVIPVIPGMAAQFSTIWRKKLTAKIYLVFFTAYLKDHVRRKTSSDHHNITSTPRSCM